MITLHLVAVGRLRPSFRRAADEYLARLTRFLPAVEREVREAGRAGNDTAQRREEGRHLRDAIPAGATVVALTREGQGWSSEDLARRLGRWRDEGRPVAFLLGGATGLDPGIVAGASHRWSLGPLTLPHELARVVVLEQLYRAGTILDGQRYHKGGTAPARSGKAATR
jgi:23S rRNA (pseudouridine1915-N3)-methyltransferase